MLYPFVRRAACACTAFLLLAACEGPTDADNTRVYQLASIEGNPLPTPYTLESPPYPAFNVVSGSLVLAADGTATESWTLRCRTDLPDWVTCQEPGDLTVTRTGTHTADPLVVHFDDDYLTAVTTASRDRVVPLTNERGSSRSESFEYVR